MLSGFRLEHPRYSSRTAFRSGPTKSMVARCAGAGSVVAYNYMDMGYINYNAAWIETGLNASHMVGPPSRSLRGELRLQRRQRRYPRQQHLSHVLPQSLAWHPGPVCQPGRR